MIRTIISLIAISFGMTLTSAAVAGAFTSEEANIIQLTKEQIIFFASIPF